MLTRFKLVADWYQNQSRDYWHCNEVEITSSVKESLLEVGLNIEVFNHSAKITLGEQISFIPSQYLLLALKIRPLATLL